MLAGDLDGAVNAARRWLALDPLQEAAHALLVRLYDWTGRRSAALRQYRECVRLLDAELGVPPLDETTAVYQAVLERRLRPPSLPPPAAARPAPARPGPTAVAFVDRVDERAAIVEALAAVDDRGHLIVVEGEAGIGKSRLVAEALRDPRLAGRRVVRARSHDGETDLAYALVADLLRAGLTRGVVERLGAAVRDEVARLVPELGEGTELPPLDSPGARSRFSGALADAVAAAVAGRAGVVRAGVLCLEDLQWADPASVDFLAYLARRLPERALRVVATWRSERLGRGTPLRRLLATARRDGTATAVTLHRLAADDLAPLVRGDADLAARVLAATEGLPLLVVEYLAALDDGAAPPDTLPGGARDLLAGRVDGVSDMADRVLAAAAVIGRDLQPEMIRAASGRSEEEVAAALEELVAAGILVEVAGDAPGYEFAHGQLRAIAYEGIGLARRRLLHRRTAEALGARDRRRGVLGAGAAEVARHHRLAGQDDAAAVWEAVAGDRARALLALDEAAAHYTRALALGHPDPARIHVALGDVSVLAGRYGAARAAFETAAAFADPGDVGTVERRLGEVSARLGDWGLADSHYEAALAADPAPPLRARVLADRALVAHRAGRAGPAHATAEAALRTAEAAGDDGARAQALNVLGLIEAAAGRGDRAEARLAESLALARRLGDPAAEIAAANNLARLLRARGAVQEALALARGALERFAAAGDRHREAALHSNVADLLHDLGRRDEAVAHLRCAAEILADVGEPGVLAPEVWKLAEW